MNKSRLRNQIRCIVFDVGGVILRLKDTYEKYLERSSKKPLGIVEKKLARIVDMAESGYMKPEELRTASLRLARSLGIKDPMDWYEFHKDTLEIDEKVVALLKRLSAKYEIAILTDADEKRFSDTVKKYAFWKHVDYIFVSCYMHAIKKNKKIFRMMLDTLELKPSQTIFIDDTMRNIEVARSMHIPSLHFTNYKALEKNLHKVLNKKASNNKGK